jgi:hypothetical protein
VGVAGGVTPTYGAAPKIARPRADFGGFSTGGRPCYDAALFSFPLFSKMEMKRSKDADRPAAKHANYSGAAVLFLILKPLKVKFSKTGFWTLSKIHKKGFDFCERGCRTPGFFFLKMLNMLKSIQKTARCEMRYNFCL